jgi:ATP-dependent helicase/nuclease subunit A
MIRALKQRGIAVAGADRMRLSEQIAVMDLMALGDFVLLPEDDLTLATVLKSPLIGLDDDDLFELAHGRRAGLWEALRDAADKTERFARAHQRLQRWLARADFLAPYEFFAALLEEDGGAIRRDMIGRLGPDAADAVDEFLNLALGYDATEPPSLQCFLHWVRRADVEIKRDMEQGRNEVRIMTVHGAKGLEANIVFLPDTCATRRPGARLLPLEEAGEGPGEGKPRWLWAPSGLSQLEPVQHAKAQINTLESEEYHRLLYVAMTRARDQLYVCGWEGVNGRDPGCWYDLIWQGVKARAQEAQDEQGEKVWRIAGEGASETAITAGARPGEHASEPLPRWAKARARRESRGVLALTPSSVVLGATGTADEAFQEQLTSSPAALADQSRFARGRLIHTLLEHLPGLDPARWFERATAFVEARGGELAPQARNEIVSEVIKLLNDPEFAPLFGPGSQAEVPIIARFPGEGHGPGVEISGQIDRLVIGEHEILVADYKTNRPPPQHADGVAPAYLAQLAAYRMALARAYPEKPVRCALVWTAAPALMAIPDELLDRFEEAIKTSAER